MSSSMRPADNYPRISGPALAERRAKMIAHGRNPDDMPQLDRDWTVEWSPSVDAQPQKESKATTTRPILTLTPPEKFEVITDAEWRVLERYVPLNPKSPMTSRRFIDLLGEWVIAGTPWTKLDPIHRAGAIRSRLRYARLAHDSQWRNLEVVARREFDEPRRSQLIRIGRYICSGDRSVIADRPRLPKGFHGELRRKVDDRPTRPTLAPVR